MHRGWEFEEYARYMPFEDAGRVNPRLAVETTPGDTFALQNLSFHLSKNEVSGPDACKDNLKK